MLTLNMKNFFEELKKSFKVVVQFLNSSKVGQLSNKLTIRILRYISNVQFQRSFFSV